MKEVIIDTNCVLRFLLDEKPESIEVEKLLAKKGLRILVPEIVFAEVVWVLKSFYNVPVNQICSKLEDFLLIESVASNDHVLFKALAIFREGKVSFIDSYLAAVTISSNAKLYTFDQQLKKLDDLEAHLLRHL